MREQQVQDWSYLSRLREQQYVQERETFRARTIPPRVVGHRESHGTRCMSYQRATPLRYLDVIEVVW